LDLVIKTCGESIISSNDLQSFSTPNWPVSYPANQDCYWTIQPDDREGLGFDVTFSEGQTKSEFDYVEVNF